MNKSIKKLSDYISDYRKNVRHMIYDKYLTEARSLVVNNESISLEKAKSLALRSVKNKYANDERIDYIFFLDIFKDVLQYTEQEWKENLVIFSEFNMLSKFLLQSPLNVKESLNIVLYLLDKEIFNQNEFIIDFSDHNVEEMTYEEFVYYKIYEKYNELLNYEDEKLSEQELQIKRYLLVKKGEKESFKRVIIEAYRIKYYYFDKIDTFNETDLERIIASFERLGIEPGLCQAFAHLLNKKVQKRKDKEIKFFEGKIEVKKDNKLSSKEYNKIFKEIESYYDIQNHRIVKFLTLKEIIYLVSLLYKINVDENEIKKCIQVLSRCDSTAYENPIVYFSEYYEKMVFYSDNNELRKSLESILEYSQELFMPQSDDDYRFWKEAIGEEMKFAKHIIRNEYQYELEKGRKLNLN